MHLPDSLRLLRKGPLAQQVDNRSGHFLNRVNYPAMENLRDHREPGNRSIPHTYILVEFCFRDSLAETPFQGPAQGMRHYDITPVIHG